MNNTAKKLIQIYSTLNKLPAGKLSKLCGFIEELNTQNKHEKPKRIGKLAGLCKVEVPKNLESEIRQVRKETSDSIISKWNT